MKSDMQALVLNSASYRENDAIVTYLSKDGCLRVLARGVQKMTSKNRRITQPFSKVTITLNQRNNQLPVLLYGSTEVFYFNIQTNLVYQSVCFVLNDIMDRVHTHRSMMEHLEWCWRDFHEGKENYTWACLVLRDVIVSEGIQPYLDGCIHCGKTRQIETMSVNEGGLLCHSCNHGRFPKRTKAELVQMLSLFRVQDEQLSHLYSRYVYSLDDFIFWARWIEYHFHIHLASLQFLLSI